MLTDIGLVMGPTNALSTCTRSLAPTYSILNWPDCIAATKIGQRL